MVVLTTVIVAIVVAAADILVAVMAPEDVAKNEALT